jgi:hypothetical protein
MITSNLRLVVKSITKLGNDLDTAAKNARDEMAMAITQLAKNEIKGRRPKGQKAVAGQPPMNRTGNLRRSIRTVNKKRTGFASYSAVVGPTIIYGRSVEVGGPYSPPSWYGTSATKGFPYMEPAFQRFRQVQRQIVQKHIGKLVR